MQQSVVLHFGKALVDQPVISRLVRDFEVEVNILQAYITPDAAGHMFSILEGEEESVGKALDYLRGLDVRTILPTRNVVRDEEICVHCGACVGSCRVGALTVEDGTRMVLYDSEKCIACELCIPACPYGSMESIGEHLRKEGEI